MTIPAPQDKPMISPAEFAGLLRATERDLDRDCRLRSGHESDALEHQRVVRARARLIGYREAAGLVSLVLPDLAAHDLAAFCSGTVAQMKAALTASGAALVYMHEMKRGEIEGKAASSLTTRQLASAGAHVTAAKIDADRPRIATSSRATQAARSAVS